MNNVVKPINDTVKEIGIGFHAQIITTTHDTESITFNNKPIIIVAP